MKLNHECIRDVLLAIEDQPYNFNGAIEQLNLTKFSDEDVRYTVEKLVEAGYIQGINTSTLTRYDFIIRSLTFNGHGFLDNIRPQEAWDEAKSIVSKIGSASVEIVSNVAAQVITNLISKNI